MIPPLLSMTNLPVKDWEGLYEESLGAEILRSERRRVTILAGLFVFAACVYTFIAFLPGILHGDFRLRFRAQWPWIIALYGAVAAYEWALRAVIGWLIEHHRQPNTALRYLNAFLETSIPTVMLFIAASLMGPRDALGSPAFLLYFFFILLSILRLDIRLSLFTGLIAALEHFLFASSVIGGLEPEVQASFWRTPVFNFSRSLILLGGGVVAGLVARQIRRQVEAAVRNVRERDRAVRIFGQYVAPQVADKLLHQSVGLGGEVRNVCVMFLDIRNFSSYAAEVTPETLMAYLNTLFVFMVEIVNQHQGIVNKFLGDGFMAVFGAPIDDAECCDHAVDASMEILERLGRLNAAGKIHPTRVGIGLHMGEAVTGNVGSDERKEYTIIGDVVNVASRLEQATKDFNARLLISEAVRRSLDSSRANLEDLGLVPLKGQPQPARIFKVA